MPDKQGKSAGTKLSAVLGGHEPSRALIKTGADIGGKGIIIAHLKAAIEQQGVDVPAYREFLLPSALRQAHKAPQSAL